MNDAPSSQALNQNVYPPRAASTHAYQHHSSRFKISKEYRDLWALVVYVAQFVVFLGLSGYAYFNLASKGFDVTPSSVSKNATLVKEYETNVKPLIKMSALYFALSFVVIGCLCVAFVQFLKFNPRSFYKYSFLISVLLLFGAGGAIVTAAVVKAMTPKGPKLLGIFSLIIASFLFLAGVVLIFFLLFRMCRRCFCNRYKELAIRILEITSTIMKTYPSFLKITVLLAIVHLVLSVAYVITGVGIYTLMNNGSVGFALSIFFILSYYWTSEFVLGIIHVTLSGVTAHWYFIEDGSLSSDRPVSSAFRRAVTTSSGSVALGSLLLSIFRTARTGFAARDCAENFAECINDYAFVQVAIYGKTYIIAARDTFRLLCRTGLRAVSIDWVVGLTGNGLAIAVGGIGAAIVLIGSLFTGSPKALEFGTFYIIVFAAGATVFGFKTMSVLTQIINSVALTTIVCLAEDPLALKRTKPELYEKVGSTFPSLPLWSQVRDDSDYYARPERYQYGSAPQQPIFGGQQPPSYEKPASGYPPPIQNTYSSGYPPQPVPSNYAYSTPQQVPQSTEYGYPPSQSTHAYPPERYKQLPPPPKYS